MSREEWEQSITTWWNEHKAMLRFVLILRLFIESDVGTLMLCCLHQIYKGNNVRRDWKNSGLVANETVVSRLLCLLKQYTQEFNVYGSVHCKNILIYIQHDAMLHGLFYLRTALRVSGGTTTHHQERKQLYLQHPVFVTPLLLPATIAAGSSNGVTNTGCWRYSCLRS